MLSNLKTSTKLFPLVATSVLATLLIDAYTVHALGQAETRNASSLQMQMTRNTREVSQLAVAATDVARKGGPPKPSVPNGGWEEF
jgi:hypothetical protein